MQKLKWFARLASLALVLGMIGLNGCAFFPNRLPTQYWSDGVTNSKVKKALAHAKLTNVKAKTFDHVVSLTGTVNSTEEQKQAVSLARGVKDVRDVLDYLQIAGVKRAQVSSLEGASESTVLAPQ